MSRADKEFLGTMLQLLFPMKCPVCGEVPTAGNMVCAACLERAKIEEEVRIYRVKAAGASEKFMCKVPCVYTGVSRAALHRLKFSGKTAYAQPFALLMARAVQEIAHTCDAIAYVPMTLKKERRRGYNQAQLLAQALGKALELPVLPLLTKEKEIQPQHTVKGKQRSANVKNAFAAHSLAGGKHILLVDDILTTGATLCECAKMLYLAGAVCVTGVAAACSEYR